MAYVQKENSGALFKNDKEGKENRPDYRGDININGTNYWISAWLKDGKNGKFLSLSVNVKESPGLSKQLDDKPQQRQGDQNQRQHREAAPQHSDPFEDLDSIPF